MEEEKCWCKFYESCPICFPTTTTNMKQEYRHTKPIRGKDPAGEKQELADALVEYIYHECGKGKWPTRTEINKIVLDFPPKA